MTSTVRPTLGLDYQAKWWVLLPNSFPTELDATPEDWARRLVDESNVQSEWDTLEYRSILPQLILEQYAGFETDRTAVLWYVPFGLPAAGYVEITLVERPADFDTSAQAITEGVTSLIEIVPRQVETLVLGEGIGYTRVTPRQDDDPDDVHGFAEMTYVFWPGDNLVIVSARSREPNVIGLMGEELWNVVETIVLDE